MERKLNKKLYALVLVLCVVILAGFVFQAKVKNDLIADHQASIDALFNECGVLTYQEEDITDVFVDEFQKAYDEGNLYVIAERLESMKPEGFSVINW